MKRAFAKLAILTEANYFVLLIPFVYAYFSRIKGIRGILHNLGTAWAPGILAVFIISDRPFAHCAIGYFVSYFAFISIYELGYLMNDTIGLRHDVKPRRRIDVDFSRFFILCFLFVRCASFVIASVLIFRLWGSLFVAAHLTGYLLLGVLILAHNTITQVQYKFVTFFQMSLLRFVLPISSLVQGDSILVVILVGVLFFTYPRFITYQTAKDRLELPERKENWYLFKLYVCLVPLSLLVSVLSRDYLLVYELGLFLGTQLAYQLPHLRRFARARGESAIG